MIYTTKTAIIILHDLLAWQKVNITAFLSGGLVHAFPGMIGEPYVDGSGRPYTALIREPIFVYGADEATIRRTYERAVSRELRFPIYTRELFATTNDADNRASVAATPSDALDLVGLGLHGERKIVDKVVNGLKLLG
ncbi:DUF2000 domain-containing protein [Kaistia dalseonensis]|uniref:DUF2000 domain-containing protein n=1 Tax=Kaistia dalseonensis TaxID=410840 RepID=A0ABU0H9N3_9HYPH|nr:DUF2000 domain-containing protein [Kaistia dalseonensis]MCX5496408.1 DUF2000 domain-containing protein [Kaistia dalseonensis]MDQ0439029.1 hypothetical protein [Kaistia dalseonensis]